MSEHVGMPVRRLKALNYEDEFASKGGGDTRVKLFSTDEMMERMLLKKRGQNPGLGEEEDAAGVEETRRRREYQQHLLMLRDGSADDESDVQKDDMEDWLQSLHIKTKNIIDKCKPRATHTMAATHVAAAAIRLKGKKLKNQSSRGVAESFMHAAQNDRSSDKSSSETEDAPPAKEPAHHKSDDSKSSGDKRAVHHAKASASKQPGIQKRDGKARNHSQSHSKRVHRQKTQTAHHGDV